MTRQTTDRAAVGWSGNGTDMLVLQAIRFLSRGQAEPVRIPRNAIAVMARVDESTVRRSVRRLERMGYLGVRRGRGRGNSNEYTVLKSPGWPVYDD